MTQLSQLNADSTVNTAQEVLVRKEGDPNGWVRVPISALPTGGGGAALANTTPVADGSASAGVATTASRSDHRHPTDTSRASAVSPTLTGTITTPINSAVLGTNGSGAVGAVTLSGASYDANSRTLTVSGGGGAVSSVAGRTGAVTLTHNDITDWNSATSGFSGGGGGGTSLTASTASGVPLIFDTDITQDVDDVMDLAFLTGMQRMGHIQLIGVITSTADRWAAGCCRALLDFGAGKDHRTLIGNCFSNAAGLTNGSEYTSETTNRWGRFGDHRSNYPDAVVSYRHLLARAEDNSVVISSVGTLTNLSDLLKSPADSISTLTGMELVTQKVKRCVVAAGLWPNSGSADYNINCDREGAAYTAANWPSSVPLIWVDSNTGTDLITTPVLYADSSSSAFRYAVDSTTQGPYRPAWGQISSWYSIFENLGGWMSVSGAGKAAVDTGTGYNTWTGGAGTQVYVQLALAHQNIPSYLNIAKIFDKIMVVSGNAQPVVPGVSKKAQDFGGAEGLICWLRPSDPDTVTVTGDVVTSVFDLSGRGNHATVPTDGNGGPAPVGPTLTAGAANGLHALTFNGTSNMLSLDSVAPYFSRSPTAMHVFMVVKINATANEQALIDFSSPSSGSYNSGRYRGVVYSNQIYWGRMPSGPSQFSISANTLTAGAWLLIEMVYQPDNHPTVQNIPIIQDGPMAPGGDANTMTAFPVTKGRLMAEYNPSTNYATAGQVAEVAIFRGKLLEGHERARRLRYLNERYNLNIPKVNL